MTMHGKAKPGLSRRTVVALILVGLVAMAAGGGAAYWIAGDGSGMTGSRPPITTYRVGHQPIAVELSFVGKVEPSRTVSVAAPFDGIVTARHFSYGARVAAGDPLFEIDTDELNVKLLEAQSALLRATQTARSFDDWPNGPEAARARRAVDDARASLQETERQVAEVGQLLERGLVPRVEHDGLVQQLRAQHTALASAESEWEQILARGRGEERQIAILEAEVARRRFDELERLRARSQLRAPMDGVALLLPGSGGGGGGGTSSSKAGTAPGDRVSQGDTLLGIAEPGSFAVTSAVDETDVNKLHPGQPAQVRVSGSDELLPGEVATVSEQGIERGAGIVYPVTIRLLAPLTASTGRARIGMTADITVRTYSNPTAVTVPASALRRNSTAVMRLDPATGTFTEVPVTIGNTTFDRVEIRAGVAEGDIVAVY